MGGGQTWGYEVVVPQGFNYLLADPLGSLRWRSGRSSASSAQRRPSRAPPSAPISLCRPARVVRPS